MSSIAATLPPRHQDGIVALRAVGELPQRERHECDAPARSLPARLVSSVAPLVSDRHGACSPRDMNRHTGIERGDALVVGAGTRLVERLLADEARAAAPK